MKLSWKVEVINECLVLCVSCVKAAKYEIQKPSTCRPTLVSLLVLGPCFAFFTLRELLRKVERGSTLSKEFWLYCSFFIKLTTCHATNLLMLRDRLIVFVSCISPPLEERFWGSSSTEGKGLQTQGELN